MDDEASIVMVAEGALQDAGHDVMTAQNAPDAIRLIADHPDYFTCLVTDLHMPGKLNGIHLVEHMREHDHAVPIVLATGRQTMATAAWRQLHQVHLLEKAYSPKLLVETVDRLLGENRVNAQQDFAGFALPRMEGEVACRAGVPRWQNPYVFGTPWQAAWSDGWDTRNDRND